MSNTRIWDRVSKPPKSALKTIGGGRLKGMTDINPQWRMHAMTELFGPCGMDWGYSILGFKTFKHDGEVALRAKVQIWYTAPDSGRNCIVQGIGGSMLVAKERDGLRLNDEAWKMAVTDALSVAMKCLGVGAEIYLGNWDGSKYRITAPAQSSYPQDRFAANLPKWLAAIQGGRMTADQVIAAAEERGRLTDEQKAAVRASPPHPEETPIDEWAAAYDATEGGDK